jgi:hypothetical protein
LRPLQCFCLEEVAFLFYFHTSACLCHRAGPVPPSRFLTALMACSARSFAGLLHPAADPGVRRVSGFCLGSLTGSRVSAFPVGASTLRSFSLASRRLPFWPSWEILPSCHSLLPGWSEDLRFVKRGRKSCDSWFFLGCSPGHSSTSGLWAAGRIRLHARMFPPARTRCFLGFLLS